MHEPRKNPGVAFWATVVVLAVLAYPISFGPACWLATSWAPLRGPVNSVYRPAAWAYFKTPSTVGNVIIRYANVEGDVNFSGTERGAFRLTFEPDDEYEILGLDPFLSPPAPH